MIMKINDIENYHLKREYTPFVNCQLDQTPIFGFIDSGNTSYNAINEQLATKLLGKNFQKALVPINKKIGTARKGAVLQVLGRLKRPLTLKLGNLAKQFKTRPIVIRGLASAFNISLPFMSHNKIDQLHSRNALRVYGRLIPLQTYREAQKRIHQLEPGTIFPLASKQKLLRKNKKKQLKSAYKQTQKDTIGQTRGYVLCDYTLPPDTISTIAIRVIDKPPSPEQGVMEVSQAFLEKTNTTTPLKSLHVLETDGILMVEVINFSEEKITIPRGLHFGTYESITDQDYPEDALHIQEISQENEKQSSTPTPRELRKKERQERQWLEENFKLKESPILGQNQKLFKRVVELLHKFRHLFSEHDEYGQTDLVTHEINLEPNTKPIKSKCRPLNPIMEASLREQVDHWLKTGVVEPSQSPWSFPVLPVPKKNGKIRWVIDYRRLNEVTIKDQYPLPNISDNLSRMAKAKVFSAIDAAGAFHCVNIRPEDKEKTAFISPLGLYQFKAMPFGLTNAPSTYARLMHRVLEGIPPTMSLVYMDDLCLHSPDEETHLQTLERILEAHDKAGLMIQPAKCHLFQERVEYLGHEVSAEGVKPLDNYTSLVRDWPQPTTIKEVRTFLGKVAYYRKFIAGFAAKSASLYNLLAKDPDDPDSKARAKQEPVQFGEAEITAFKELKQALCQAPILAYPDFTSPEPFIVDTDWSCDPGAVGGVLSQIQDGEERVICYGARKLTKRERNYSSNKGEILAVITFLKQWRYYLKHRRFVLRTDHEALKWIRTMDEPAGMILRWLETISSFDFHIQFRKGKQHANADALSRCEHAREPTLQEEEDADEEAIMEIYNITYPQRLELEELIQAQQNDEDTGFIYERVRTNDKPDRAELRDRSLEVQQYASIFETLQITSEGLLIRNAQPGEFYKHERICLPQAMADKTIKTGHEMTGGHMGIQTTIRRITDRYYFPGMYRKIEAFVKRCLVCQAKQGKSKDQRHTLISIQEGEPMQKLSIDLVGPMKPSENGNTYLLTVKDTFTRWLEAFPLSDITAENVARTLEREVFSRHGLCNQLHSDQGSNFTSELIAEVCDKLNIKKTHTPAYNPKSNVVERSHKDLGRILKAAHIQTGQDWESLLPTALVAIRTARNRHTGVTPFFAMYGREAKLPLDFLYEHPGLKRAHRTVYGHDLEERMRFIYKYMRSHLTKAIGRARMDYNGKLDKQPLVEGDLVWLFTPKINPDLGKKLSVYWTGPWKILRKISDVLFEVRSVGTWNRKIVTITTSIDRLKRYYADEDPEQLRGTFHPEQFQIRDEFVEADGVLPTGGTVVVSVQDEAQEEVQEFLPPSLDDGGPPRGGPALTATPEMVDIVQAQVATAGAPSTPTGMPVQEKPASPPEAMEGVQGPSTPIVPESLDSSTNYSMVTPTDELMKLTSGSSSASGPQPAWDFSVTEPWGFATPLDQQALLRSEPQRTEATQLQLDRPAEEDLLELDGPRQEALLEPVRIEYPSTPELDPPRALEHQDIKPISQQDRAEITFQPESPSTAIALPALPSPPRLPPLTHQASSPASPHALAIEHQTSPTKPASAESELDSDTQERITRSRTRRIRPKKQPAPSTTSPVARGETVKEKLPADTTSGPVTRSRSRSRRGLESVSPTARPQSEQNKKPMFFGLPPPRTAFTRVRGKPMLLPPPTEPSTDKTTVQPESGSKPKEKISPTPSTEDKTSKTRPPPPRPRGKSMKRTERDSEVENTGEAVKTSKALKLPRLTTKEDVTTRRKHPKRSKSAPMTPSQKRAATAITTASSGEDTEGDSRMTRPSTTRKGHKKKTKQ